MRPLNLYLRYYAAGLLTTALLLGALATGNASAEIWNPPSLAKRAVTADLRRIARGFRPFLDRSRCSGTGNTRHCIVTGSIANDNIRAQVTLRRGAGKGKARYVDRLSLTAGMGGGTLTRTYRGSV